MRVFSRAAIAAAVVAMSAAIPFGLAQSQVAQAQQAPSGSSDGGISIGPVDVDFGAGTGAITLSRTTDLGTGDAVTVTGTGFKANTPLYLAQTVAKPAVGFPTTYGQEAKVTTEADGSFTADIEVSRNVKNIDCLQTDCYIATFAAFPSIFTDRSQDVWMPISFASDAAVGQQGSGAAPGTGGPVTTVSTTSGIGASGETLRVSGTGFSAAGAGIYVGLAETGRYNPANADSFASTVYVRSTEINGGAWTVDLPVQARTGETDCLARSCAVYTLAAHGSPDRSQDTVVPVTFDPAEARETPGATPAAAAAGTPSVSASKTSGLDAAGDTITVSGTGFATTGPGIYVGVAQSDRFSTTNASAFQDTKYIRASDMAGGSWSTTLNVAGVFGDSDCTRNACAVYTFAAHGSADRSQDTMIPISFVGTATPTATTTAAPAGTAAVSASKTDGLDPAGETVTVSGTGFSSAGPGIYVGLIQDDKFSATDASAWMTTAYLTPDKIVDGAWSTEMELAAVKGDSDCTRNTCSIYTVTAHGTADRSQDTRTAVTFGAASTSSPATTSAAPTADADPEVRTLADTESVAEESGTSTETAVISVIVAAIAAVAAGAFVLRRKD